MNRDNEMILERERRVPRASGDEPLTKLEVKIANACSPRERG